MKTTLINLNDKQSFKPNWTEHHTQPERTCIPSKISDLPDHAGSEVTIYDIAKKVNMSASTVSRALNGSGTVSAKTTLKIRELAIKMQYVVNNIAKDLRVNGGTRDNQQANHSVTIYHVAKQLNISASTVSRCFTPGASVKPKTKRLVLDTAEKMGFVTDVKARKLRTGISKTIGIYIPVSANRATA